MHLFYMGIHILKIYCNNKIDNIHLSQRLLCPLNILVHRILVTPDGVLTITVLVLKVIK